MFAYIYFVMFPFILAWMVGARRLAVIGFACAFAFMILALGFLTGLLLAFFTEREAYWHSYDMPKFLTTSYVDSIGFDEPLYKMLLVPYIFIVDMVRIYVHFSFTHGTLALWIPEAISWFTLRNLLVSFRNWVSVFRD